jgi:DNA polymerase-4
MHPELKGKPVIVGGTSERGVVASCSYEARKFGIHSAMPTKLVKRLCPEAIFIRGDYDKYSEYSDIVTQIIKENSPLYEKSSIDEFYMDLTGMDKFFGCYKWATELRQKIMRETGLPISFGLSKNKTVSKVATGEAKPNGQMKIDLGTEKIFLAPMPVSKIPMVGEKTTALLRSMGVEKVKTVQEMPMELMQNVLGDNGVMIWKKANGIDNTPVEPYNERKSISTEETFDTDTIDVTMLKSLLIKMTEKIAFQLRSENKLTACITVKVRYANFDTHTIQSRIAYTSGDHILIKKVKELFDKLYNRRMLVRLVGVRFSHLVGGAYQINLFEDSEEIINLYQTMDKLRRVYGAHAIERAVGVTQSLRAFNPFNGIATTHLGSQPKDTEAKEYLLMLHVPQHIRNQVKTLREKVATAFDHYQDKRLQPNITLVNFLLHPQLEEQLINDMDAISKAQSPIEVVLKNFNHFGTDTLYIDVKNPSAIVTLIKELQAHLKLQGSQTFFSWQPNIPVAKGLAAEKFKKVYSEFTNSSFDEAFIADSMLLLRRDSAQDHYLVIQEFNFNCMKTVGAIV